ncbi:MAG: hypothetical protein GC186_04695 [Rhodobacteraceae bacterium]|nr:hypothetical protein [Paracoccaceae bacterium]
MNLGALINMLVRLVFRSALNAGIKTVARPADPGRPLTPEEQAKAQQARQAAKRARQAMRIIGRFGR